MRAFIFITVNRSWKLLAALGKARFNLYNRDAEAVGRTAEGKARA